MPCVASRTAEPFVYRELIEAHSIRTEKAKAAMTVTCPLGKACVYLLTCAFTLRVCSFVIFWTVRRSTGRTCVCEREYGRKMRLSSL